MTKMRKAQMDAIGRILKDFQPPPKMTTPKASRERLRKAVEAALKPVLWDVHGIIFEVQEVVLDVQDSAYTFKVYATMCAAVQEDTGVVFYLDEWMKEAKPHD